MLISKIRQNTSSLEKSYCKREKMNEIKICLNIIKWRPLSLSELTPYQISLGLTHLGSDAFKSSGSIYILVPQGT